MKKFSAILTILAALALSVSAAERVRVNFILFGDPNGNFEVLEKSKSFRYGKVAKLSGKLKGCRISSYCTVKDKRKTTVTATIKITGNGKLRIYGKGLGELGADKKYPPLWIDCSLLEVDGKKIAPAEKRKFVAFSARPLTPYITINGEKTVTFKAVFAKTPSKRAAKLAAAQAKKAVKRSAKGK